MLLFYHISAPFATNAAVSKTQETATLVDNSATQGDIFVPFGFWMLGERHCLSKARSNFFLGGGLETDNFYKIPARPRGGRPLTDCALLSRFGCAERYAFVRKRFPPLGFSMDFLRLALLLFRSEKCYAFGKKFTEDLQKIKTAAVYARYSSDNQTEQSIEGQLRVCEEYAQGTVSSS